MNEVPVLKAIPLSQIRENPVALRDVDRTSEDYLGLVDSVRKNGILNAIVVRVIKDPLNPGAELYGLVDGLHRFSAAKDAGLDLIPAQVRSFEDGEVLTAQILANVHKVETKPVQYSEQLKRILIQNPTMTISSLADQLSKSPGWLQERLGLTKLKKEIGALVDSGELNLSNAYALAKLPEDEQQNFLDRAITMNPAEFVPTIAARVKEIRDAKRQGRDTNPAEFVAVAHLRKIGEIKDEATNKSVGRDLCHKFKPHNVEAAFQLAIDWVLHLDPDSIEQAKQKDAARKKELEEQRIARKKEREEKARADAASKVLDIGHPTPSLVGA